MANLSEAVNDVSGLISLPDVYLRIRGMVNDPKVKMADFAKVISTDPNISIRVLRMANSAFFGFATQVDSLTRAISIMGTSHLHDLVLGAAAIRSFSRIPNNIVDTESYWRKSVFCGISARLLAKQLNFLDTDRLFVAGLLHDVGHLLMYHKFPDLSIEAIDVSLKEEMPLFLAERQLIGFDYGQAGSELMRRWRLPESYQETTERHMEPQMADKFRLETAVIHIARNMAASTDKVAASGLPESIDPFVWEVTGLTEEVIDPTMQETHIHVADVAKLMQFESEQTAVSA